MFGIGAVGPVLILVAAGRADDTGQLLPVVEVEIERGSIADGDESFYVSLKVAKG